MFLSSSFIVSMLALFLKSNLSEPFIIAPFMLFFNVYFTIIASKNLQKSSAIQNISVTLSSVIIVIIVCNVLIFNTLNLQQFSLIIKFYIFIIHRTHVIVNDEVCIVCGLCEKSCPAGVMYNVKVA
ncbi:4Fe-4S binding protein [Prevotella herbatica]|uniref:4Fe-4S binding protein n=1 Tax=Prevotella herbatica TaxID=2801997 RepID=UPI0037446C6D